MPVGKSPTSNQVKIPRAIFGNRCARSTREIIVADYGSGYKQRSATPRKWNPSPTRRSRPPKRRPSARLPTSSRRASRKSTRWVARAAFNRSQFLFCSVSLLCSIGIQRDSEDVAEDPGLTSSHPCVLSSTVCPFRRQSHREH